MTTSTAHAVIVAQRRRDSGTVSAGAGPYRVYGGPSADQANGPTHQPGVMPGQGYEALRTPFGQSDLPGAGVERTRTTLDLATNRQPARLARDR